MDNVFLTLFVSLGSYLILYNLIWKNDKFIVNQYVKHLSFLIWIGCNFFVAIYIFESGKIPIEKNIVIQVIALFMLMIATNIIVVTFFSDKVTDITSPRQRIITLILDLSMIFFFFSFLHYFIYWGNVESFVIDDVGSSWFDIAVSFIYYSFSTSLTYSASGIEPISSIAKIISMIQITFFYLVLGESLFSELQQRQG